ncbi:hypothetical protein IP88_14630 [alpha proteobacterium AAP81b]|nr:hypothetical protein IP88_14630 [alpha proteobacterium AAP81b]
MPLCFVRRGALAPLGATAADLPAATAAALGEVLPLLGCGEEAASLAFAAMAANRRLAPAAAAALAAIARDEAQHDALLKGLLAALPAPADPEPVLAAAQAMHVSLGRTLITGRLARVAGLDSAVCLILARVLRRLPAASDTARVLRRIHADEARHVAIAGNIAAGMGVMTALKDEAAHARALLVAVIGHVGAAFDGLGVEPDRLRRDLARLPAGLFAA